MTGHAQKRSDVAASDENRCSLFNSPPPIIVASINSITRRVLPISKMAASGDRREIVIIGKRNPLSSTRAPHPTFRKTY